MYHFSHFSYYVCNGQFENSGFMHYAILAGNIHNIHAICIMLLTLGNMHNASLSQTICVILGMGEKIKNMVRFADLKVHTVL